MDCFGDPLIMGKNSTDLFEGKCTWITCSILEKLKESSPEREFFYKHFGRPEHVNEIRQIIIEKNTESEFLKFQMTAVEDLKKNIARFSVPEIRSLLNSSIDEIVNRKK